MTYTFINHNKHSVSIPGPNKEIIRIAPGKTKILSDYFLKYCPKYIKVVKQFDPNKAAATQKRKLLTKNKITIGNTPPMKTDIPDIKNIGIGILSCNRLYCIKRLLESIKANTPQNINIIVSDESTEKEVKDYLRSVNWITLLDHAERKGVVHNTNNLLHALIPFKFKMILNDDIEVKKAGWHTFYFQAMKASGYHHFCYREYNVYGANKNGEKSYKVNNIEIKTITTKPQGAVLTFDDVAFKYVGYYDHKFPRYGMAHVDWSNRVAKSSIQPPGFHDVNGADAYFKIYPEKTVEEDKNSMLKKARQIYDSLDRSGRMFVPPQEIYKSKIHVIVNSYDRPDLLSLLLSDIRKNKSRHDISVHIYDDASTISYTDVINAFGDLNIVYKRFPTNHGKENYWQVVNEGFADTQDSNAHFFIKLDDDVRLVDGFFDKCISYWNNIPDPKKICMNPLLDDLRKGKAVWTGKNPHEVKFGPYSYWNSGWVDMMFFCEKKFFEELEFKINPISKSRWVKHKTRSSGVGAQLSERLTRASFSMYQPGSTLVTHEDHKSQMNANLRRREPIVSASAQSKTIISMASIQERIGSLCGVVDSVYDQCDQLNIYLNDYETIPSFLNRPKIVVFDGKKLGNLGDVGKFYFQPTNSYVFTIDDDIIYPSNYVPTMINKIEQYGRKCCVGVHGVILHTPMIDYYKSRKCYHYKMPNDKDVSVHIIGTGTLAYHSNTISAPKECFSSPNMADIWFGILAQQRKIDLKCIERPAGWLQDVPGIDNKKSIHGRRLTAEKQTAAIKSFGNWIIHQ